MFMHITNIKQQQSLMKLLYPQEHFSCYNFEQGDKPVIQTLSVEDGQRVRLSAVDNKLIFVLKGRFDFVFKGSDTQVISKGQFMLLPAGCTLYATAKENSNIIILRIRSQIQLCDTFSIEKLLEVDSDIATQNDMNFLDINERVESFLAALQDYINDGLRCYYFYQLKIKEFFYLLRAYYTKEELRAFFNPLISSDLSFSGQVFKYYKAAKTVQELAEMLNYSLSGFQKKFKRVFGVSAYHWITEQRVKSIRHEINCNEKTFKEISNDYGFSSPSHFNDFCKTHFGETPGNIREKNRKVVKD